jgi:hypothetical protein
MNQTLSYVENVYQEFVDAFVNRKIVAGDKCAVLQLQPTCSDSEQCSKGSRIGWGRYIMMSPFCLSSSE